ncbi:MAG: hypothetical protein PHP03_01395 [Candidatus Pacebacteria bacterium]|nr:hypothetical protein [Candidatus Paceibacterota bacterium]
MKKIFLAVAVVVMACGLAIADGMSENISGIDNSQEVVADTVAPSVAVSTVPAAEVEKSSSTEAEGRRQRILERIQLDTETDQKKNSGWKFEIATENAGRALDSNLDVNRLLDLMNNRLNNYSALTYGRTGVFPSTHFDSGNGCSETSNWTVMFGPKKSHWSFGLSSGKWSRTTNPIHQDYKLQDWGWGDTYAVDISRFGFSSQMTTFNLRYNLASTPGINESKFSCFVEARYGVAQMDFSGRASVFDQAYTPYGCFFYPVEYEYESVSSRDKAEIWLYSVGAEYKIAGGLKLEVGGQLGGIGLNISYKEKRTPEALPQNLEWSKNLEENAGDFDVSESEKNWVNVWDGDTGVNMRFYIRVGCEF